MTAAAVHHLSDKSGNSRVRHSAGGGCAPHILGVSLIGKTAVSKTVPREGYVGSNPTPPAI